MAYQFTPVHIPGKKHVVPDTLSRRTDSPVFAAPKPKKIAPMDSAVTAEYCDSFGPPSWVSPPLVSSLEESHSSRYLPDQEEVYLVQVQDKLVQLAGAKATEETAVITWDLLENACKEDSNYMELKKSVTNGFPETIQDCATTVKPYYNMQQELTTLGDVVMLSNRPVIPDRLRPQVLSHLHASHAGVNVMLKRALQSVYWPSYTRDVKEYHARCESCKYNAPSNPSDKDRSSPDLPPYPFHTLCADFFSYAGKTYLIIVDKYSNWISIMKPTRDDSASVIKLLRQFFMIYGVCEVLSTDGAKVFTSREFSNFCSLWGVVQRVSSAYYAQANKGAEVAVKSAERLIMDNISPSGSLDTDKFARAVLQHRNAPDPETGVSPAEIVFGHPTRD